MNKLSIKIRFSEIYLPMMDELNKAFWSLFFIDIIHKVFFLYRLSEENHLSCTLTLIVILGKHKQSIATAEYLNLVVAIATLHN